MQKKIIKILFVKIYINNHEQNTIHVYKKVNNITLLKNSCSQSIYFLANQFDGFSLQTFYNDSITPVACS